MQKTSTFATCSGLLSFPMYDREEREALAGNLALSCSSLSLGRILALITLENQVTVFRLPGTEHWTHPVEHGDNAQS